MKKRRVKIVLGVIAVAMVVFLFTPQGQSVMSLGRLVKGLYGKGVFDRAPDRKYEGDSKANLKALYTAMMFVHESDGQFPKSDKWMDAVESRIKTGDMTAEEAEKKLHDPSLADPSQYGYAMNDACSLKYKDDLKDGKTILLFTSSDLGKNAHGDPAKGIATPPRAGGNWGVTLSGDVVSLPLAKGK